MAGSAHSACPSLSEGEKDVKDKLIAIEHLTPADWNPNMMDVGMRDRLRRSLERFGLVLPLVVRPVGELQYEVIGGNHRLEAMSEAGHEKVPCVVVQADDTEARLLAQALNNIEGDDDIGLKGELFREVLEVLSPSDVSKLLPESADSLRGLSTLGQADMAASLRAWDMARSARLRHMTFQLSNEQVLLVEKALKRAMPTASKGMGNPNSRGNALYQISQEYLAEEGDQDFE
jgi:ParB family chromosome partitioning protein